MGNPKKPIEHHKRAGNYRPSQHGRLTLPVEIPDAPADLHPTAAAAWNVIGGHVKAAGVVARIDLYALRLLCESIKLYLDAQDEIEERGITLIETSTVGNEKTIINPAVRIRSQVWAEIVKLLTQFGMTPASRTGLATGDTTGVTDDARIEAILNPSVN